MGSNMQKQAIPCVQPEVPLVATGLERRVAADSGRLITALKAGTVSAVDGQHLVIKEENGENRAYPLVNFMKTNDNTVFHHRPIVNLGQKVKTGEVLADTSSSVGGQLALGQNALVAFLSAIWTRTGLSGLAPKSDRATFWSARLRPRARPN